MLVFAGFGLLNNLLYVVILSAAIDLVGANTPKGVVLLANIAPAFLFKVSAPFFFHMCPYAIRVALVVALSFVGMLIVAASQSLALKLTGIVLASLSSGIGEVSFLQLTHFYEQSAVHAWSSGTGAAGLVGSFLYMAMTSWAQVSPRHALLFFSLMPFLILVLYFRMLPDPVDSTADGTNLEYHSFGSGLPRPSLEKLRDLCVPYILPLMCVYMAEYVINQGISPTLLFDLLDMPMFRNYRDAYVLYGTLYQIGVFVSRSSGKWVRINNLWCLAVLQMVNVVLAVIQSLFLINPSIYVNFAFMLFEGLLGGAAYVNTYMLVMERVSSSEREFAMGAVAMSDSSGIVVAALISIWLEKRLCGYQIDHGRPWCSI